MYKSDIEITTPSFHVSDSRFCVGDMVFIGNDLCEVMVVENTKMIVRNATWFQEFRFKLRKLIRESYAWILKKLNRH